MTTPHRSDAVFETLMCLLALIAAALSAFLAWHTWKAGPVAGCNGATTLACDEVLASRWSRVLGIPVGALAVVVYAVMAVASLLTLQHHRRQLGYRLLIPTATMAAGAALWFTALQLLHVQALCLYCLMAHSCSLLIALVLVWQLARLHGATSLAEDATGRVGVRAAAAAAQPPVTRRIPLRAPVAWGIVAFGLLVTAQVLFPPTAYRVTRLADSATAANSSGPGQSEKRERESLERRRVARPVTPPPFPKVHLGPNEPARTRDQAPLYGNAEAEFVIVELQDYTCQTCRELYPRLEAARARYGDGLAIMVLPVALEKQCNADVASTDRRHRNACKLASLALAVWMIDSASFSVLHEWLMKSPSYQQYSEAWNFASRLVGSAALLEMINNPQIPQMLADNHRLWKAHGKRLPILIVGDALIQGRMRSNEDLFKLLESQLGIEPRLRSQAHGDVPDADRFRRPS